MIVIPLKDFKIALMLFFLFVGLTQAQDSRIEVKSITKFYQANDLAPALMLSRAEQWFGNEENSEDFKIISLDQEKGEMLVEGSTKVLYKNIGKELYPKRSGMAEVLEARFGNKIMVKTDTKGYSITYEDVQNGGPVF